MMLKWGVGVGKEQAFPLYLTHWKFQDQGPNSLILLFHPLLSVNTRAIFSFSREYQPKLQSRLQNYYPQLSSLPVFSKIDSFRWLYKYKTEPTTALKPRGKVYHQLGALLEPTFWPGSTEHSLRKDGVPRHSSPRTSTLRQIFGKVQHAPGSQEAFPCLRLCLSCLLRFLTEMTLANNVTREASWSVPLLGISHTSFTPSKCQLTFSLYSNSFVFPLSDICSAHWFWLSSVRFSSSVVSDSLRPHVLPHARPPCPSPTPRVYANSCPLSQWCHTTISSSLIPFSSCLQSFPASGSFQMSQFFASGGQSIGVSAASVLPMNIQDWFPLGWTGWISLQSKGLSRVFSNTTVQKQQFFGTHQPGISFALLRVTYKRNSV